MMITRAQYMDESHAEHVANLEANRKNREGYKLGAPLAFQRYYGQFVTPEVKAMVARRFTIPALVEAAEAGEYFNTIELRKWDALGNALPGSVVREIAKANANGGVSISDRGCVLKEAARLLVEESKERA